MAKIKLSDAMGLTPNMTPSEVSKRWSEWSIKYPKDKGELSTAVVASMDALAGVVVAYDIVATVVPTVYSAYTTAMLAYKAALAMLPGIGAMDGATTAAEQATVALNKTSAELAKTVHTQAISVANSVTNSEVDSESTIA